MKPGPCQVRSKTESPCLRSAEVEILGVAFCGPCAREQEAYFAIGELTHEEARGPPQRAASRGAEDDAAGARGVKKTMAAEMHHGLADAREPQAIALTNS